MFNGLKIFIKKIKSRHLILHLFLEKIHPITRNNNVSKVEKISSIISLSII